MNTCRNRIARENFVFALSSGGTELSPLPRKAAKRSKPKATNKPRKAAKKGRSR